MECLTWHILGAFDVLRNSCSTPVVRAPRNACRKLERKELALVDASFLARPGSQMEHHTKAGAEIQMRNVFTIWGVVSLTISLAWSYGGSEAWNVVH